MTGACSELAFSGDLPSVSGRCGRAIRKRCSINSSGTRVEQNNPFNSFQRETIIVLGVLIHIDNVNIIAINQQSLTRYNPVGQIHDLMHVLKSINVNGGNVFSGTALSMNISKSAGQIFKVGSNKEGPLSI